jgi:uncharacterized protein
MLVLIEWSGIFKQFLANNSRKQQAATRSLKKVILMEQNLKIIAKDGSQFGRGIFAIDHIRENEVICTMQGPLITREEHINKYGSLMFTDPLQIGLELYIDLIEPYRSFNHACEPNAGICEDGVIFALTNIKAGEEIFFDYSTTCDDEWTMVCGCSSQKCRKRISKFVDLPSDIKQFYFANEAVLRYLERYRA